MDIQILKNKYRSSSFQSLGVPKVKKGDGTKVIAERELKKEREREGERKGKEGRFFTN